MNNPVHLYDILEKLRAIAEKDPAAANVVDSVSRFNGPLFQGTLQEEKDSSDDEDKDNNAEDESESKEPSEKKYEESLNHMLKLSGQLKEAEWDGSDDVEEDCCDKTDEPEEKLTEYDGGSSDIDNNSALEQLMQKYLGSGSTEITHEDDEPAVVPNGQPGQAQNGQAQNGQRPAQTAPSQQNNGVTEDINITTTGDDAVLAQILKLAGIVGGQTTEMLPADAPIGDKEGSEMSSGPEEVEIGEPEEMDIGFDDTAFNAPKMTDQQMDPMGLGLPGEIPQDPSMDPIGLEQPANDDMGASEDDLYSLGLNHGPGAEAEVDIEAPAVDVVGGDIGSDLGEFGNDFGDEEVEEAFANSPDEHEYGIEDVTFSGDDFHKSKGAYSKVASGDNPMRYDLQKYVENAEKKLSKTSRRK